MSISLHTRRLGGASDVLLAAVLWGTTGTASALIAADPLSVGAARIVLGGLVLFAVAMRGGALFNLLGRGRRTPLVFGACCVAVYQLAFFAAVARTGVAIGTVVTIGSGPVFAGILSRLLGHAVLTRRWALSTAGAVAGCTLLVTAGRSAGVDLTGVALALTSGFAYAVYAVIAGRLITTGADDRAVMGAFFGGAALLLVPVLFATPLGWLGTTGGVLVVAHLAILTTAVGYLLYARGLRTTPVAVATTLTLAEPAVAALLGVVVLGERLGIAAVAGLALLAASLAVLIPRR